MDDIFKFKLNGDRYESILNYGICEYFRENDSGNRVKLMGAIYSKSYVLNYGQKDHYSLILEIEKKFRREDCWIGSAGDELNFFTSGDDIDYNQVQIIINILLELKQYYIETGINKKIGFMGLPFSYTKYPEFESYRDCSDIDNLISILEDMKSVRLENVSNR